MREYDIVIVGAGVAGLSAGLFAARCGRSCLVLGSEGPGGALLNIGSVEDFPGFPEAVSGFEIGPALQEQAVQAGAKVEMTEVTRIVGADAAWALTTSSDELRARAVILATGTRPRELEVPGERQFTGYGVSNCASCDGPLHRGRAVGVVGGGDSGLVEALELTHHVSHTTIFEQESMLTAHETYRERVLAHPGISVLYNTVVEEVVGERTVSGVRVRDISSQRTYDVELEGLFVCIGRQPNSELFASILELDPNGYVPTDAGLRTAVAGLYAAGDIRSDSAKQAVTAAGDGATAALMAHDDLSKRGES